MVSELVVNSGNGSDDSVFGKVKPMGRRLGWVALGLGLLLAAAPVRGQSLAEVARKEQERRKQIKTPSRVYTNEDLKGARAPLTTGAATAEAKPAAAPSEGGAAPAAQPPAASDPKKDEQAWRERIAKAREELERQELFLQALQSRATGLYAEFTARDDPAQRLLIERDRQRVLNEMERVKADIERLRKAVADIEEEARRAGVPPGWLR
jgi:hypothetical protein